MSWVLLGFAFAVFAAAMIAVIVHLVRAAG